MVINTVNYFFIMPKPKKNQKANSRKTLSGSESTEELCKKYGIPFQNTTEQHLGQTSIHFLNKDQYKDYKNLIKDKDQKLNEITSQKNPKTKKQTKNTNQKKYTFEEILKIEREQGVYMRSGYEDFVIRSDPKTLEWFAKPKGGREYKIDSRTNLVTGITLEGKVISKEEYNEY